MLIFTFARSTPVPSDLTRTLTLKSTTRLTATNTFICCLQLLLFCSDTRASRLVTKAVLVQVCDGRFVEAPVAQCR